jgi:hypothetical protein
MESIVMTYHFLNDQVGFNIIDLETYELLKREYPDWREKMFDPEINPYGARPTLIEVDLYENAQFVDVEPEPHTIEHLMGLKSTTLGGTLLRKIEKL